MYLLCNLDDEHYTESIYEWHKTMDDAKERCVEMEVEVQGEEMREEILSHMEFYPVDESKCKFTDVPGIKSYRYDYHIGTSLPSTRFLKSRMIFWANFSASGTMPMMV